MKPLKYFALTLLCAILLLNCKNEFRQQPEKTSKLMVYVGTYTQGQDSGKNATGIYIYEFDTATGRLRYVNTSPATVNPSFLVVSQDHSNLYAVNETGSADSGGFISAFSISDSGRRLQFINKVSSKGDFPCYIETDKSDKFLLTANYGTGNIAMFRRSEDGSVSEAIFTDQHTGKGLTSRQESAHAHSIRLSPGNKYAYSGDLGTDIIYVYAIDTAGGNLKPVQSFNTAPGAGPRHIEFHPLKNIMYVINELNGTIDCMTRNENTGLLSRFQVISTIGDSLNKDAGSADIHMTSSGKFLYATNRGSYNNIAIYAADTNSGRLTYVGSQPVQGEVPRNFGIDPTGRWLLVANQKSCNIVTFRIDPKSGKLADTGISEKIPSPVCIKFIVAK
jgi:6-phosphogluconolactonase